MSQGSRPTRKEVNVQKVNCSRCNWIGAFTYLGQGNAPYIAIEMDFLGMISCELKRIYKSALDIVVALCLIVKVMAK